MRITILHESKNIIQYQWIGLGDYIVELVCIGTINKEISTYLCHDNWRVPYMNINTKLQHTTSMNHTNWSGYNI